MRNNKNLQTETKNQDQNLDNIQTTLNGFWGTKWIKFEWTLQSCSHIHVVGVKQQNDNRLTNYQQL